MIIDNIKQQRSVHGRLDWQALTGYELDENIRCANHSCSVRQKVLDSGQVSHVWDGHPYRPT